MSATAKKPQDTPISIKQAKELLAEKAKKHSTTASSNVAMSLEDAKKLVENAGADAPAGTMGAASDAAKKITKLESDVASLDKRLGSIECSVKDIEEKVLKLSTATDMKLKK